MAAVGKLNFAQLVYPAYIFVANGLLAYIIIVRRPHVPADALRSPEAKPGKLNTSSTPKAT